MSDHDRQAQTLFEAARRATPRPELARQIMERARRGEVPVPPAPIAGWHRATLTAGFAVAALAAGVALLLHTQPEAGEHGKIAAEPVRASAAVPDERQPRALPSSTSTGPVAPEPSRALPTRPSKEPERARSLPEQLRVLKQAREALRAGGATRTLAILDSYERGANSVDMSAEATLLRIEALVQLGRRAEADQLIELFVARHSDNPLVDRARSLASGRTEAVGMGRELENGPIQ